MRNISRASLLPSMSEPTRRSSYMTNQSETKLEGAKISYSPTINASTASARQYSMQMGLNMASLGERKEEDRRKLEKGRKISVGGSTVQRAASSQRESVITGMSAKDAEREVTGSRIAEQSRSKDKVRGMAPKYLRYNLWDPASDFTPNTADWTELAKPLVGPPELELKDEAVTKTLRENSHLFKIVTPVRVEVFESYLSTHPNRAFVQSVCNGLWEGFWPWAITTQPGYPQVNDESKPAPADARRAEFLRAQRDVEVLKGRFSPPFAYDLLPGMYSMPIYAVPKPTTINFRLVTDQSCGKYSLNSMIQHDQVTGYPLDNLVHFGEMLMDLEKREPGKRSGMEIRHSGGVPDHPHAPTLADKAGEHN